MQRVKLILACLFSLSWIASASAQAVLESDSGVAVLQDYSGGVSLGGAYFDVRTMTGDGVGYRNGYTQIGSVLPIWVTEDMFIAPQTRLLITDNSEVGVNVGGMARRYDASRDRIWGFNAYYDRDHSVESFDYSQVGFGVESLGQWLDFRANAYFPVTTEENFVRELSCGNDFHYVGNYLGVTGTSLFQQAIAGGDFEFGVPLTKSTPWLRGYAGLYAYDADENDPIGFRGRIEANISNDLIVGVNVTTDQNYGTNVNAVVDFRFAGFLPTRYFPQWTTRERMLQPVQRNWRVTTADTEKEVFVAARNPDSGNPYFIVWVDNSNNAPGTGTFENPFSSLPTSAPGADLILVRRGTTSLLNPLNGHITLTDNQRMLGEGKAHQIDVQVCFSNTNQTQTINLPGFQDDGNFPFLSSGKLPGTGDDNIITLADNNEVSAFNLVNATGYAVTNIPAQGSTNFNLNCLNITGNGGGIFLTNASGQGIIRDVNALNNVQGGISIESGPQTLALTVTNVTSNSLPPGTQAFGMQLIAQPGDINAVMTNVEFNRNTDGLILAANTGDIRINMTDGDINDNLGDGIRYTGTNNLVSLTLTDVNVNRNDGNGIGGVMTGGSLNVVGRNVTANDNTLDNFAASLTNTAMTIDFQNATFNSSVTGSGFVVDNSGGNGVGTVRLENVTGNNNFLDGFRMTADNLADLDATISTAVFNNNGRDAFSVSASNGSQLGLNVSGVQAINSGRHGLNFNATGGSRADIVFLASNLNNAGQDQAQMGRGVNGFADNSTVNLTMVGTTAANAGADGLGVTAVNNAQVTISVARGDFSDSGQNVPGSDAVNIVTDTGADLALVINNTPLNNGVAFPGGTQDDGLSLTASNNSTITAGITNSDLSNNLSNAIDATVSTSAVVTLSLTGSDGLNSGEDGIRFDVQNGGVLSINLTDSDFDFSGQSGNGNGINGFIDTAGVVVMNADGSSFANSADNGLLLVANNGSSFTGDFTGGSFANSGQAMNGAGFQDAINVTANSGSLIDIGLVNTPTSNLGTNTTQQHGLIAVITNGSDLVFNNQAGDMSNNTINAMNVTLVGGALGRSTGTIDLLNTPAESSGEDGFIFNVSASDLTATVENGSFNDSGAGGVTGSAVNGTITNTGTATLNFTDTTSNNALDNGLVITATGGSTFTGNFDNSQFDFAGSPGGVPTTAGNAVQLNSDNSTINITMVNGSTGNSAGGDGLLINAQNGSTVTGNFTDGSFSNAGQFTGASAGVNVINDASTVTLTFDNTPTTNNVGNTTQAYGLLFNVTGAGVLTASFIDGNLSNNTVDGINGTIADAGSTATVNLSTTNVDSNGNNGASFNVGTGATLNFNIPAGASISNNGANGVIAFVDGGTANFNFDSVTIDGNGALVGGDGFAVLANNGAVITGLFTDNTTPGSTSISGNAGAGINLLLENGSSGTFADLTDPMNPVAGLQNVTIDNNGAEGILAEVSGGSTLLLDVLGGSISNNGVNGPSDNVNIMGTDAGTMIETQFVGTVADSSTRSGFNFTALNGTMFLAQMRGGVSGSNNINGNGLRFVADGAGTQAVLYMDDSSADGSVTGTNVFSNNGTQVNTANGGPSSDLPLTGSGIFFQATNVDIAAIRIAAQADGNGNGGDPLANRDIDGDGDGDHDGMYVNIDGASQAGFELVATSSASNNVDEGLDLNIANVTTFGQVTKASTLTPPDVTIGAVGGGISITDFAVDGNSGNGINVVVTGPVTLGDILIDNVSSTNNGGDGLLLSLTDVTGTPNLTISNSGFGSNGGNGINLDLDNAPLGNVAITNNLSGTNLPAGTLDFSFNNLIWTTFMNNNSTAGFDIASVTLDIAPTGQGWRPDLNPFSPGRFQPMNGSDVTTGLTSVNGNAITPGTDPLQDSNGMVLTNGGVPPNSQQLTLNFTDFNTGEQLDYELAHTLIGNNNLLSGTTLVGSTGTVTLEDGRSASGVFTTTGLQITQAFPAIFSGIASNGLDGIRISQNNSSFNSLVIDGNSITTNGQTGSGDGINFIQTTNSDILDLQITNNTIMGNAGNGVVMDNFNGGQLGTPGTPIEITGNTITGNTAGDGIRIDNVVTTNTTIDINLDNNTISTNAGNGVSIDLTAGGQNLQLNTVSGNTINGNTAGAGITMTVADNADVNANFDTNTINSNSAQGINYALGVNSNVTSDFTNNTINGNGSHGINIPLQQGGSFTSNNFYGNTIGTAASRNGGQGVRLIVPNAATFNWTLGDSTQAANNITGNTDAGVGIVMTDSTGSLSVQNTNFANTRDGATFGGDGLGIQLLGSAQLPNLTIGDVVATNTTFNSNSGQGISIVVDATAQLANPTIRNVTVNGNSGDGLNVTRTGSGVIDNFVVTQSSFTGNTGDGIDITASFALLQDEYNINNNTITGNAQNGIRMNAITDAQIDVILTDNTIDTNGQNGVSITTTVVSPGDAAAVFSGQGPWTGNTFSGNGTTAGANGAGLEINGNGVTNLAIGTLIADPLVFSNSFANNAGDGIEINNGGSVTLNIIDAAITGNNTSGTADGLAGIDINNVGFASISVSNSDISLNRGDGVEIDNTNLTASTYTFTDDLVTFNGRDGIEFVDTGNSTLNIVGTSTTASQITDNGTSGTGGRGVDIIVGGNDLTNSTVNIDGTSILRNNQEGVYVVLTSDANQGSAAFRDNLASAAMANNGAIGTDPLLNFNLGATTGNIVNDNGQVAGNIGGSGLVMRVGTTRGGDGPTVPGGFASAGNGGVIATVTGNQLTGNAGADVFIESFVSISNSGNSGTAWTDQNTNPRNNADDVYNPAGYQSDPLARLDLIFSNNTGEENAGTNVGAAYNNNDAVFKSRGTTNVGPDNNTDGGPADDNGPFGSGSRSRNAQRLAARNVDIGGAQLPPLLTIGGSDSFLFPGLGQSTFRVNDQTTANNNFMTGLGFIMDNPVFTSTVFDANGVGAQGGGPFGIDNVPYGWTLLP